MKREYITPTVDIVCIDTSIICCSCGCYNTTDEQGTHHTNCDCPSCEDNGYSHNICEEEF